MIEGLIGYDDRLLPALESCAERSLGRFTVSGLIEDIFELKKQVYVLNDWQGVCITSCYEDYIYVHCAFGENSEEWRDELDDHLRAWAKATGKTRIFGLVRPGWSKWAKSRGYKELHRELGLEV